MTTSPDIKPRSRDVTDGLEKAAARGMLRAVGLESLDMLFTPGAVMLGLVYGNLPFMILPLYTSLEKFDWTMLEAAADLGANLVNAFVRVMLAEALYRAASVIKGHPYHRA